MTIFICPICFATTAAKCLKCKVYAEEVNSGASTILTMARALNGLLLSRKPSIRILTKNIILDGYCQVCGQSNCAQHL